MNNKRLFFVFLIIFLLVILAIIIKKYIFIDAYEKVYSIDSGNLNSIETRYMYDAIVTDDTITFYDNEGNSIIYVFYADRLENVFNVFNANSESEAKRIALYYTKQIGNGEIAKVSYNGTTVSVMLDMNIFSEYKNCSKSEIENILLSNINVLKREE